MHVLLFILSACITIYIATGDILGSASKFILGHFNQIAPNLILGHFNQKASNWFLGHITKSAPKASHSGE
jgi:hypothetical protein